MMSSACREGELDLSGLGLGNQSMQPIVRALRYQESIKQLNLSMNPFDDQIGEAIIALGENYGKVCFSRLECIDLRNSCCTAGCIDLLKDNLSSACPHLGFFSI
jgi:hypothetical protein